MLWEWRTLAIAGANLQLPGKQTAQERAGVLEEGTRSLGAAHAHAWAAFSRICRSAQTSLAGERL
jgi:hypothetical protein